MNIDPSEHVWYNPLTLDWGEIAVGIITLPYGWWISVVAGTTIFASGGTVLFGLSDIGEGIAD